MGVESLCEVVERLKPAAGMVVAQVVFAGLNLLYKVTLDDGMEVRVLVAYRYLFAAAFLGPLAFFLERKNRPGLTLKILIQSFFCGLLGGTLAQNLYIASVKMTSATFASAVSNLIPAITFILAVSFRLERLEIQTASGQAKLIGTLLGVGGAMLLTFYKGPEISPAWSTNINLLKPKSNGEHRPAPAPHQESSNRVMASLLVITSCFSYAGWLILQAKMAKGYPCHISSTALMCLMGAVQATVVALWTERGKDQWRMGFGVRLLTVAYAGILASGLTLTLLTWCIRKKGPLYASVFNPLVLVIVALLSSLLLNEKLHLGCLLGAVLIVIGLYLVLWGKGREAKKNAVEESPAEAKRDPVEVVVIPESTPSPEPAGCVYEQKTEEKEREREGET